MQRQHRCQEMPRRRSGWAQRAPLLVSVLLLVLPICSAAAEVPQLGAQVWIEPGQTVGQVKGYFRQLAEAHMLVARLFVMWSYVEPKADVWDFTLYDAAFAAASKYHVRIVATLTPTGPPPFLGGDGTQGTGVVGSAERRAEASVYIAKVVERYRENPALDTWLLLNEPGQPSSAQPLAVTGFRTWLRSHYAGIQAMNTAWGSTFASFDDVKPTVGQNDWNQTSAIDWMTYWREYQTAQLAWLASQVRRLDTRHPLHLNPHALISNLAVLNDNLPKWRSFLDTLGCSIHPAWHFSVLPRDEYALGVSYINDLIAGSIEPKHYWVTELQGGTNISSANRPLDPTENDIAQWVWTSVGGGADRIIFWLLNARRRGAEAGEWSLLDFQEHPSDRMQTASAIASMIDRHKDFFSTASTQRAPVTLILSLDTMTLEDRFAKTDYAGRDKQAQIVETLGFYKTIAGMGAPPAIKHFDDFDWRSKTAEPRVAILPDVRALTAQQIDDVNVFTRNGNILMVTGLTGFYDPQALAWPLAGFPLKEVTGAELKEVKWQEGASTIMLNGGSPPLPTVLWVSTIHLIDAKAIANSGDEVTAAQRALPGGGRVIWVPSPIGTGAWESDTKPLASFLRKEIPQLENATLFRQASGSSNCVLRVLKGENGFVTVLTNGEKQPAQCNVVAPAGMQPKGALWGEKPDTKPESYCYNLDSEGTAVTLWGAAP
jgi:beta-galactosidase